jgi:hypothetical protein
MEYLIALFAGVVFWWLSSPKEKPVLAPLKRELPEPIIHQERRGGPTPINPAKQAACKAARDEWLAEHNAVSAGSTKRGDVYLCHGERN